VKVNSEGQIESVSMDNFMAKLAAMTIIGDDGNLLFSESDVQALGKKSAAALKRVADVASELSGLDQKKNKATAKN